MIKKIVSSALLLIFMGIGFAQAETIQSSPGCQPRSTTVIGMALNLRSDAPILTWDAASPSGTSNFSSSMNVYDSLGTTHVITVYFNRTGDGTWDWHAFEGPTEAETGSLTFDDGGQLTGGGGAQPVTFSFSAAPINLYFGPHTSNGNTSTTQYATPFVVLYQSQDGYPLAEKCVLVISPNGGEVWEALTTHTVEWDASSDAVKFKVFFSLDNGTTWQQVGSDFVTGSSLEWVIPFVVGQKTQCLVMVIGYDSDDQIMGGDTSDGLFTIQGGSEISTMVVSPNGAETWVSGSTQTIEWAAPPEAEKFRVFFSEDSGTTWQQIGTGFITEKNLEWVIPFVVGQKTQCLVMVIGYDSSERIVGGDSSDGLFTIDGLEPIYPNGGETFIATHVYTITWTTSPGVNQVRKVKLYYSLNGGITWRKINAITGNPGTYDWKVPSMRKLKTNCKIKVVFIDDKRKTVGKAVSQDSFTIEP